MLLPFAGSIAAADERLAPLVTAEVLAPIVALVPDAWLVEPGEEPGAADQPRRRARYVDYLLGRLAAPRPFVEEADRARAA